MRVIFEGTNCPMVLEKTTKGAWRFGALINAQECQNLNDLVNPWKPIGRFPTSACAKSVIDPDYLFHSPDLVDEDFNPQGVVKGHWQDGVGFVAAVWNNDQDCWYSQKIYPTHFMPKPRAPNTTFTGLNEAPVPQGLIEETIAALHWLLVANTDSSEDEAAKNAARAVLSRLRSIKA